MDNKKRIIINATCASKKSTGVGIFTQELVSRLVAINPERFFIFCVHNFLNGFENMKLISDSCSPDNGPSGHRKRILWSQTLLPSEYKLRRGGLLFTTLPEAPISVKNKIVVVHDIIPAKFPQIQTKMTYYYLYVVPWILKTSRHLVFDSENTRKDVLEYYKIKNIPNSVIYAGFNKGLFKPIKGGFIKKKYGFDRYFFYVGDMRPYKNLNSAIQAFSRASLEEDILFVVAGKRDDRYFPEIQRVVQQKNLAERVIFCDYVPQEDLPHFYNDAIALFFPSKYEGFGLPPLEAMATGSPVITTRMASIPEVCGEAALYVNPDDIDDMASALERLAGDSSLREYYIQASLKRSSLFGWEKTASEYMNLLIGLADEI
ncbi:MAG: glycosyltransferase family 1 protein [Spirochaetota bacterium]|nr:glycosyltransferase family 1 protein [Spirochaetota bacterium]